MEQAKFTYSPLGKSFWKTKKNDWRAEQGRKQIDAIRNRNERLAVLANKDDQEDHYKNVLEELFQERSDKIKELINEITQNDLTYYFKGNDFRK